VVVVDAEFDLADTQHRLQSINQSISLLELLQITSEN